MDMMGLLSGLLCAAVGWLVRHYEIGMRSGGTPQSAPGRGVAVTSAPDGTGLREEIVAGVRAELLALESRLQSAGKPKS